MAIEATEAQYVNANGIDIHYVEAGHGEPLVLLHQGMVSTSPLWAGSPVAYVDHVAAFAEHFRVIAPDLRGCGRTINPGGGGIPYAQLVDDALGLIDALGLDRPLICGFSDGATIATILGIRSPGSVRAIVNHAGHDLFNPQAPSMTMGRQVLGGSPDATEADPAATERFFESSDQMRPLLVGMRAEHGESWTTILTQTFNRITTSPGHTFEDLRAITAPTLILAGDRDGFCSVEEGAQATGCWARASSRSCRARDTSSAQPRSRSRSTSYAVTRSVEPASCVSGSRPFCIANRLASTRLEAPIFA